MKKFKLIAVLAMVVMAAAVFANSAFKSSKVLAVDTYHYTLDSDLPDDENTEANWELGPNPEGCSSGDYMCTITAPVGINGHPDFSQVSGDVRTSPDITNKSFRQ